MVRKPKTWLTELVSRYKKIRRTPEFTIQDLDEANKIITQASDALYQIIKRRFPEKK